MPKGLWPSWIACVHQDARYAVRGLRHAPGFAVIAILTLAIGIGACTAVFSVVDRLLFRNLPYPHADQLVSVGITGPISTNEFMLGRSYVDWRRRQTPFQSLTSMFPAGQCDLGERNPARIHCISVEANFLSTLGVSPIIGRDFTHEDDLPNAPRVTLISYALWHSRFGGNPSAVGRTIQIDDQQTRIQGVLPKTFEMPQLGQADVLLPEQLDETVQLRSEPGVFLRCFARLKNGVSINRAREQLWPLFQAALRDAPPELRNEIHLMVRSLRDRQSHDARLASWLLLGAVLALLLISCGNVTNLMLARASAKRREVAMRAALGAGRLRLFQQSLLESLTLSLLGGAAGCGLAWIIVRTLVAALPDAFARLTQVKIDLRVLVFAAAVSVLSAVLFGLLPAFEVPGPEALTGWHSAGSSRGLFRHMLLASQVAISLILLTGASLFARSLSKLEQQPLGMRSEHVITASFVLSGQRYRQAAQQDAFYNEIEARLRSIPGVNAFALSDSLPPAGGMHARPFSNMRIAGRPPLPREGGMVAFRYVTPAYFDALGTRMLSGRSFSEADRSAAQAAIILNASLAKKMFGNRNPIGEAIALGSDEGNRTIWSPVVGVAADVKNDGLSLPPGPEYYVARTWTSDQLGHSAVAIFRTHLRTEVLARWIRQEIAAVNPALPVTIESMNDRVSNLAERPRFLAVLVGLFAALGLLIAAVGLYAVTSFLVNQQTRSIGVRMALGATPGDIARLVFKFVAVWTGTGALLGFIGSLLLTRFARGLLFEISPRDPFSFTSAAAVLLLAALLASCWPSLRASRVDPAISLRHE